MQIAITRPVRIGDSVCIEGNWGYVEDLRHTFEIVRTWDDRRLVLPLRYLVTEPYEDWTFNDTHIVKPIYLYADFGVDVDAVRERFEELLRASDEWDERQEPTLQVTSLGDDAVEIRALCSAKDTSIVNILLWIISGGIAGWLGRLIVTGSGLGQIGNIVVGIAGAFIGGFIADRVGIGAQSPGADRPTAVASFVWAVIGAVVLLVILNLRF